MEAGYGGPVWHASVHPIRGEVSEEDAEAAALRVLEGVGDPGRGQWIGSSEVAVHVRRRLTEEEEAITGPMKDLRDTPAGELRVSLMEPVLRQLGERVGDPYRFVRMAEQEVIG